MAVSRAEAKTADVWYSRAGWMGRERGRERRREVFYAGIQGEREPAKNIEGCI